MDPTLINGIPAHPLLVHVVVVLLPLSALCLVACAAWPPVMRRFGLALPVLALVSLVFVPLTTSAGEWLQERVPESSLVEKHAEMGDELLPWAIGLLVVAVLVWFAYRRSSSSELPATAPGTARTGRPATVVWAIAVVLSVVVAVGAVVQVYRIGDSGAKSVWRGSFTTSGN
ncbi:DUF2231 domain-containing protein [Streptomyces sp. NPDC049970]|uniref:DUF2231 domain-containing protein n=1 Tax=Streptomyces sp. NPDC049970 TaxID=3155033 RepID=UPI0034265DBA